MANSPWFTNSMTVETAIKFQQLAHQARSAAESSQSAIFKK
jgi:hypothetical protein